MTEEEKVEIAKYYINIIRERLVGIECFVSSFDMADTLTDLKYDQLKTRADLSLIQNILNLLEHDLK